jgi:hypothetical protein
VATAVPLASVSSFFHLALVGNRFAFHSMAVDFAHAANELCGPHSALSLLGHHLAPRTGKEKEYIFNVYLLPFLLFKQDSLPFAYKKRLTQIQILQFVVGIVHTFVGYKYAGFCPFSWLNGLSMLILSSSFYRRRY